MALLDAAKRQSVQYRGLRDWLDKVQAMGELLCINGADWDAEMGSITQMLIEKSNNTAPAILLTKCRVIRKDFVRSTAISRRSGAWRSHWVCRFSTIARLTSCSAIISGCRI